MTEQLNTNTADTTAASLEAAFAPEMSLSDYRAMREGKTDSKPAPAAAATEENKTSEVLGGDAAGADDETTESTDGGEGEELETAASETEGESNKPKKKGGFQRKLEAKEKEIEDLRAQLAAAKPAETPAAAKPAVADPVFDKPKPKLEAFANLEEYTEAVANWIADERDFKRGIEAAKQAHATQAEKARSEWNTRKAETEKKFPDYSDVLKSAAGVSVPKAHQQAIFESEHGPELAYMLAKDPAQLKAFVSMSPLAAARHLGKLEATLTTPKPETKTRSSAPAPVTPINSRTAAGAKRLDISQMSLAEYRAARANGKVA